MLMNRLFCSSPLFSARILLQFCSGKPQAYVPVRPLTEKSNLLFRKGDPQSLPGLTRLLSYTPFLAFGLDGFINQWDYWTMAGTFLSLLAARYALRLLSFFRAFEVYELRASKDLKKFYFTLENNRYSYQLEEAILKMENKTFEEKFVEALKAKTHNMPEQYYNDMMNATPEQLTKQIQFLRAKRDGIIINLDSKYIEKFEFVAKSQMYSALKQNYFQYFRSRPKIDKIFEGYTALKQKKQMMIVTSKRIKEWNNSSVFFVIKYQENQEKKLEEYLRALGQGRKIITDL